MRAPAYLLLSALLLANNAQAKVFQFLYIEASEGNSSGGHVAIQLTDEVYHYQYEKSLIRLFKHNADDFRARYQFTQNRNIHSADINVSDATFNRLSHFFKQRFFEQQQYLKHLQAMRRDQLLLQALREWKINQDNILKNPPELMQKLSGAGLFYGNPTHSNQNEFSINCNTIPSQQIIIKFKQILANKYGDYFLTQKTSLLAKALGQLAPTTLTNNATNRYTFSDQYGDMLNGLLVLQALYTNQHLVNSTCFQTSLPELKLNDADVMQAYKFQQDLMRSALLLITSKRPDWGYALFITLARMIVIEHSIQTRQWTFLDDTDETVTPISRRKLALYTQKTQQKRHDDLARLYRAASSLGIYAGNYEQRYIDMEMAANRYWQWRISDNTGWLRYNSERRLPTKALAVNDVLRTDLSTQQLDIALANQQHINQHLQQDDNAYNAYHLIANNCVTALFKAIDEALIGQSERYLGGTIDPTLTFIPFQAYDSVQKSYTVINTTTLSAYRRQALTKMYKQEHDGLVYMRESNIFSASAYNYNPDDAWFVFFTDDAILPRPLFGAINTAAAVTQSLIGLVTWPFDEGKTIKIGVKGVFASLPELVFFNIRKGSYPYPMPPP